MLALEVILVIRTMHKIFDGQARHRSQDFQMRC
jgi:hypothetical protein